MPQTPEERRATRCLSDRARRARNLEARRAYDREWKRKKREADPERARAIARKFARDARAKATPEQVAHRRALQREYERRYRAVHPEKARAKRMRYQSTHRAENRARSQAYGATHPEVIRLKVERRRARMAAAPINDFTVVEWQEMKAAYGYRCVYCGRKMARLTMDHILPLRHGGSHTKHNIVPACQSCNSMKHIGPVLRPIQPLLL